MAMIHETCGNETMQGETRSACGALLVTSEMTWVKPWSGARHRLQPAGVLAAGVPAAGARTV